MIVPARNEEKCIRVLLDSILSNDYPQQRLEILIVDGMSTDSTREIVRAYVRVYPSIRLLENPRRIIPAALNIGISAACGEIIIRMDAHTTYAPDYIRQAVQALETSGATMVGAVQKPTGDTPITQAISSATSSPFGVGNSYYHYGTESCWVEDSVYLGTWYKRTLTTLGGFNEKWLINEDSELNHRLRAAGGRIWLSADLHCSYRVRGSLWALAGQFFRYGMWAAKTSCTYPSSLSWRRLVPPTLVAGLLFSLALARTSPLSLALLVPCAYALTNLLVSGIIAVRQRVSFFRISLAFCTLHLSWGTGFLVGLARFWTILLRNVSELPNASSQRVWRKDGREG